MILGDDGTNDVRSTGGTIHRIDQSETNTTKNCSYNTGNKWIGIDDGFGDVALSNAKNECESERSEQSAEYELSSQ